MNQANKYPVMTGNIPVGAFEIERSVLHEGRFAKPRHVFIKVRCYTTNFQKKKNGKMKRDCYKASIECLITDVDTPDKLQAVGDHIFNQIQEKYKLVFDVPGKK